MEQEKWTFEVPGDPVGKGRPRYASIRGAVRAYTPIKTLEYEKAVRQAWHFAHPAQPPLEGPVQVYIMAYFPVPDSFSKARKERCYTQKEFPAKRPDADNIGKTILDALNGLAYGDDANVTTLLTQKRYVYGQTMLPHVHVTIYREGGWSE